MATLTAPGGRSFSISAEHIAQHPGSLLATMLADLGGGDKPVTLELDLSAASGVGSPLADWAEAASITCDLYRLGHVSKATVAAELAAGSAADFLTRLRALVDYLALVPGVVARWLPPVSCLTLQDCGIHRLQCEALAADAVMAMLASGLDTRWLSDDARNVVAAFYVALMPEQAGKPERLNVFALSPQQRTAVGRTCCSAARLLPAAGEQPGELLKAMDVVTETSQHGSAVSENHRRLGAPLWRALSAALSTVAGLQSAQLVVDIIEGSRWVGYPTWVVSEA